MDGVSLIDIAQTVVVGLMLVAQRRFNRYVVLQFKWTKEMVEDAGWNWERDVMYTPANSKPSDRASG